MAETTMTKQNFIRRNHQRYYEENPLAWTEQARYDMNRKKTVYAEVDYRGKRIVVRQGYDHKKTLKERGYRYDGAGGWYIPLGTPEENRRTVTALRALGIEARMNMETVRLAQYRGEAMGQIYDAHGPERGQEIVDRAARLAPGKFGLLADDGEETAP